MYNSCVRGTMLYSSECWALRQEDKKRFERQKRTTYQQKLPPKSIETEILSN